MAIHAAGAVVARAKSLKEEKYSDLPHTHEFFHVTEKSSVFWATDIAPYEGVREEVEVPERRGEGSYIPTLYPVPVHGNANPILEAYNWVVCIVLVLFQHLFEILFCLSLLISKMIQFYKFIHLLN